MFSVTVFTSKDNLEEVQQDNPRVTVRELSDLNPSDSSSITLQIQAQASSKALLEAFLSDLGILGVSPTDLGFTYSITEV